VRAVPGSFVSVPPEEIEPYLQEAFGDAFPERRKAVVEGVLKKLDLSYPERVLRDLPDTPCVHAETVLVDRHVRIARLGGIGAVGRVELPREGVPEDAWTLHPVLEAFRPRTSRLSEDHAPHRGWASLRRFPREEVLPRLARAFCAWAEDAGLRFPQNPFPVPVVNIAGPYRGEGNLVLMVGLTERAYPPEGTLVLASPHHALALSGEGVIFSLAHLDDPSKVWGALPSFLEAKELPPETVLEVLRGELPSVMLDLMTL